MTYGRTSLQELRLEGRRLVNRHFYGDGRWGWHTRTGEQQQTWHDWRVVKARPKVITWAKPSARKGRKTHAIRYAITAEHLPTGNEVYLTVWWCGGHAHSLPDPQSHPVVVCEGCYARLAGIRETWLP